MESISSEALSGIIGALVGSISAFALGAGREAFKDYKDRLQLVRRSQFTLIRQRNELKMLVQYMDTVRHLKDRHRKIPRTPLAGQLNQLKAEELDFLLVHGDVSAQELVALDLSKAAYVNVRFVNEMRNEAVQKLHETAKLRAFNGQHMIGEFDQVSYALAAQLTDGLYQALDDAIEKCHASWELLSKANNALIKVPGEKCFEDKTPKISDSDWCAMQTVRISIKDPSLRPFGGSRIIMFEDKADRLAALKVEKAERWLLAHGRLVTRLCLVIAGRTQSAIYSELSMHDASELARVCGLMAYYWVQEDVVSLVDPWHSRPSAKCQASWAG
jgi:hypothetical protein